MIMTKQHHHQECEEDITILDIIDINLSALYLANFVCSIVALRIVV